MAVPGPSLCWPRIDLEETAIGTRITILQTFPSKEALKEVVEKYGAIEGGMQHLAKLQVYLGQMLYCNEPTSN